MINDKKSRYEFIETHRSQMTLDEIGRQLNLTKQRVGQIAKDLGLNVKLNKWRSSKVNVVAELN